MAYHVTLHKLGKAAARASLGLKHGEREKYFYGRAYTRRYWSLRNMKILSYARTAIQEASTFGGMSRQDALDTFRNGYYEVMLFAPGGPLESIHSPDEGC